MKNQKDSMIENVELSLPLPRMLQLAGTTQAAEDFTNRWEQLETWGFRVYEVARVVCNWLMLLCLALALAGCGKRAARPVEKSLVHTAVVQPMESVRSDGEASYLALVRFDHETDLSFKVGGILVSIGPSPGTDWDEATPVKAGSVIAEL